MTQGHDILPAEALRKGLGPGVVYGLYGLSGPKMKSLWTLVVVWHNLGSQDNRHPNHRPEVPCAGRAWKRGREMRKNRRKLHPRE